MEEEEAGQRAWRPPAISLQFTETRQDTRTISWMARHGMMDGRVLSPDKQGNGILWRQATPHRKLSLPLSF